MIARLLPRLAAVLPSATVPALLAIERLAASTSAFCNVHPLDDGKRRRVVRVNDVAN